VNPGNLGAADSAADYVRRAAYVFIRSGTTWSAAGRFIKASYGEGRLVWRALALSGDGNTLAGERPNEDSAAKSINGKQDDDGAQEAGAVYVYT